MKRYLWTVLLALVLTGCAQNVEPDYIPTTLEDTVPPETSCYVKDSAVEQSTGGAVMMYDLPEETYTWMEADADKLVLASGEKEMVLTQGSGNSEGFFLEEAKPAYLQPDMLRQATTNGTAFYDRDSHRVIFVRGGLQEYVVDVPVFEGDPVFSADGNLMYYCKNDEIRVRDLNSGIDRMLKSQTCKTQVLTGLYFDGALLGCNVTAEDDTVTTAFISSDNGQTVAQVQGLNQFFTAEDSFVASCKSGSLEQLLAGTRNGETKELLLPQSDHILPLPGMNLVLLYGLTNGNDLTIDGYDIATGKHSASVVLPGAGLPKSICPDTIQKSIWLLASDDTAGEDALYQWLPEKSPVADGDTYMQPYYTAENPDETGLAQLKNQADTVANTHGVEIHIWKDAVEHPGDYTLEPEYQTKVIAQALEGLEAALNTYPQNFLSESAGSLHLCIVRSVDAEPGVQYRDGGAAYIILPVDCNYEEALTRGISGVVISHILGNSSLFDNWESLNPSGFTYGQNADESLFSGSSRAFADAKATESVTLDRAMTFFYALRSENKAVFESEIMQKKLKMLCQGIRDAWNWKKVQDTFPWEQYLDESIAPA